MTERQRTVFFFAIFALVFYLVGASFVQSFVGYPAWRDVGVSEFAAYYQGVATRIILIMVLPRVVEIVLTVALFWLRPRTIPRWAIVLALALNLLAFASSAMIQLQVRAQVAGGGLRPDSIDAVIHGDYVTQLGSMARAGLYLWMMYRIVGTREAAGALT